MKMPPPAPAPLSCECLPDVHGILLLPTDRVFRFLERWSDESDPSDLSDASDLSDPSDPSDLSDLPPLHLNLGIEGLEEPDFPIEENAASLLAAVRFRLPVLPVLLSGEWERAFTAGLLTRSQLQALQALPTMKDDI